MIEVSVIVPVYNVEKYLESCINSILKQSFSQIELILVDDGSSDNSGKICDEYKKKDDRVVVIHQENAGLSAARNSGIEIAQGKYLMFVDSDDFIVNDIIQVLYHLCEKNNAEISTCANIRCSINDSYENFIISKKNIGYVQLYEKDLFKIYMTSSEISVTAWAKLYSAKLFDGVRYPVGKYHEDVFTTYLLIDRAHKIVSTDQVGYVYRRNEESITMSKFSKKRFDIIEGKLQVVYFVEQKYKELAKEAYKGVIYACNRCIFEMGKCGFRDKEAEKMMQRLYRRYSSYYLKSKVSLWGKCIAFFAFFNLKLTIDVIRLFSMLFKRKK